MADRAPDLQPDSHGTLTPPEVHERPGPLQTIGQTATDLSARGGALIATPVAPIAACRASIIFAR